MKVLACELENNTFPVKKIFLLFFFFFNFLSSLTLTECGWKTVEKERVMFAPQNLKTVFFSFATDAPCSSVAVYF